MLEKMKKMLAVGALFGALFALTDGAMADTPEKPTVYVVSAGFTDPFFGAIKKGTDDAAAAMGVEYQYIGLSDMTDVVSNYSRLVEQAISRKPDALVVANFFPDALNPILKRATAKGIPVVILNSGVDAYKDVGAITGVGEDAYVMGFNAGEYAASKGVKHALCVNHVPANPALEQRCKGYADALVKAGATSEVLTIPVEQSTIPTAVIQAIKGVLQAKPDIDGVFTLGSAIAENAATAIDQLGAKDRVFLGTCDISSAVLAAVKSGSIKFVLDQQPYIQGYYSVIAAAQYAKYHVYPVGKIVTGPFIITPENVEDVLAINSQYGGIRGAR